MISKIILNNKNSMILPLLENLKANTSEYSFLTEIDINCLSNEYYIPEKFLKVKINKDLSILSINIRSMSKNFESFKLFFYSLNYVFDVICFSET